MQRGNTGRRKQGSCDIGNPKSSEAFYWLPSSCSLLLLGFSTAGANISGIAKEKYPRDILSPPSAFLFLGAPKRPVTHTRLNK